MQEGALFDQTPINKGRQLELDIAKGLAVFFMIAVHVLELLAIPNAADSNIGMVIEFFGGVPAAPVFMFAMGFGIIYSRNSSPGVLLRRGVQIFFLGYLLNFLRGWLPFYTKYFITGYEPYFGEAIYEFFYVDILQFAGIALIFFGVAKKLDFSIRDLIGCGLIFGLLNIFLVSIKIDDGVAGPIASLFWGATDTSFFPFLTWIIYVIAGYVFGYYLIRCNDKSYLYRYCFIISCPFALLLIFMSDLLGDYNYYQHTLVITSIFLLFILFWVSLLYFTSSRIPALGVETVKRWSRNVTTIYFVHWCIIGWLVFFLDYNSQDGLAAFLLVVFITLASDVIAEGYSRIRKF
ncbi:MAG TPA: acyltransferase family protein [Methanospirillum sp.]|nr:acyltransferase family protein [Methanospirillum sp.]